MRLIKRLWWIFGPLLVAAGLLFGLLVFTNSDGGFSEKILTRAASSLETRIFKGRAHKHAAFTDEEKNYVPFMGSSELTRFDSFHPSVLADKYKRDYTPFLLGYMGTQSFAQYSAMQPIIKDLAGKKVVFSISPQWFDPKSQSKAAFQTFYSKLQGISFLNNATDSPEDIYAANRYLEMGVQNDRLFKQVADGNPLSELQKKKTVFEQNLLSNEDLLFSHFDMTDNYDKKILPREADLPDTYDYATLDQLAIKEAKANTTNNNFGIKNSFYNERLRESIGKLKGTQANFDYTKSIEYNDFQLVLNEFAKNNIEVLFVIPPINQKWIDYTGLRPEMYQASVKKIKYQLESQGFNHIADLSHAGVNEYYMQDTIHIGWRGWLDLDTYINPFLTGNVEKSTYDINNTEFLSKNWASMDPADITNFQDN
ncbi:D-alanyl-lipoteichoic acid biosynthesis protein DltD [Streptococcaceae bacterium ESL0687]|nr:D-alanyl-lipoteichoic acid biosynthesis protein DltD [Streptococcaceae bacterium ESL0687]